MCPSAPRVCSEPGGQEPALSLSLDRIYRLPTPTHPVWSCTSDVYLYNIASNTFWIQGDIEASYILRMLYRGRSLPTWISTFESYLYNKTALKILAQNYFGHVHWQCISITASCWNIHSEIKDMLRPDIFRNHYISLSFYPPTPIQPTPSHPVLRCAVDVYL